MNSLRGCKCYIIIQILSSFLCNVYAAPIDNKQTGLEKLHEDHSNIEILILYGLDLIILLLGSLCMLYLIVRTFVRWFKHKSLHMSHKLPFYMALSDFLIYVALIIDLYYPAVHDKQWPNQPCKIVALNFYYFAIFNMILVGSLALVTYFRVCKAMNIDTGILDYKLFTFPILIPTILSVPAWPYLGANGYWCFQNRTSSFVPLVLLYMDIAILLTSLFCYIGIVHAINVARFRNDREIFRASNKKITSYLFMYILQWTPVMVYIICDIEKQANMRIFAICIISLPIGGIINTYRYISNEGWWNTNSEPGQDPTSRNQADHSVKHFGGPPTVSQWRELSGEDIDINSNRSSILSYVVVTENNQSSDQIQLQNQPQNQPQSNESHDKIQSQLQEPQNTVKRLSIILTSEIDNKTDNKTH